MTVGFVSIGAAEDLLDATFSGFAYENIRSQLRLIGNGTDTGNVVVQDSAKPYREARFAFLARDTAEKDLVRGYFEDGETVLFVDFDGSSREVIVYDYASSMMFVDVWTITVTLLELSEPLEGS